MDTTVTRQVLTMSLWGMDLVQTQAFNRIQMRAIEITVAVAVVCNEFDLPAVGSESWGNGLQRRGLG